MKVAMYYNNSDVRIEEMPRPAIGDGELLLKVMACGICGSDVMEWYRIKKAPLVLGHEIAGEISEVGRGVEDLKEGDRLIVSHHIPCNTCRHCLRGHHTTCDTLRKTNIEPGGFAEYTRIPQLNVDRGVFQLPDGLTYEQGTLAEPLATVVRSQRLAGIEHGDNVLVIGSGMTGLLHVKLALAQGAGRVFATDISDFRLRTAEGFGAQPIKASEDVPARLKELNKGLKADKVIVCTGSEAAARQALKSAERGGTIVFYAVPRPGIDIALPLNGLWKDEIRLMTTYGASPRDMEDAIRLIQTSRIRVDDMISHRLPLDRAGEGFCLAAEARESLKVIINPHAK